MVGISSKYKKLTKRTRFEVVEALCQSKTINLDLQHEACAPVKIMGVREGEVRGLRPAPPIFVVLMKLLD